MATACLFIGFDRAVAGMEKDVYGGLYRDVVPQLLSFVKEGYCESYDVIGLTPHCGTLNSFILIKGERSKLDELRRTDTFERLSMRLARATLGYGVVPGLTLEGIDGVFKRNPDLFG